MERLILCKKHRHGHRQRGKLGGCDGQPHAVNAPEGGQDEQRGHLEQKRAQKGDQGAGHAVAQRCEKGGRIDVEALDEEAQRIQPEGAAGQCQQLEILKMLYRNVDILILDDSSSALDYKTDAALRKELREHFAETTCVIIAQRISSIMNSDHIMVLEDGQMIGYGTHQELMETCEIYREIGKSQMGI